MSEPIGPVDATRVPRYGGPATFARLPRIDEVSRAERLVPFALEPHDRREQLLRGDQPVPRVGGLQAGVAVAARVGCLTEVAEQVLPSA